MRKALPPALCVVSCLLLFLSHALAQPEKSFEYLPFVEIERGEISSVYRFREEFTGADIIITDLRSWEEFWGSHTHGISPPPPLPDVKFPQENVIVVMLGHQSSGGGPSIGVSGISQRGRRRTVVHVLEDRTPGHLAIETNPYQIIVTPRLGRSIRFEHLDYGNRLCQSHEDCPPEFLCSRGDPTCASPVTGVCRPRTLCTFVYIPVCGCDGITYSNGCLLFNAGAIAAHHGECE